MLVPTDSGDRTLESFTATREYSEYTNLWIRAVSCELQDQQRDTVSILQDLPGAQDALSSPAGIIGGPTMSNNVLRVAFQCLPVPGDTCSWQDIFDFKAELRDKRWGFRRFLKALSSKEQTEAEIRDEIEWMVNEYKKAMAIHEIKASQSFVDVFVICPLEIIENLAKFNWSKVAKGALQVRKRKSELMEAEMKAPGRECAYVFDAQRRFGRNR
jgi:hypothetical protein